MNHRRLTYVAAAISALCFAVFGLLTAMFGLTEGESIILFAVTFLATVLPYAVLIEILRKKKQAETK